MIGTLRFYNVFLFSIFLSFVSFGQHNILSEIEIIKQIDSEQDRIEIYQSLLAESDFESDPLAKGILRYELGKNYWSLDEDDMAIENFQLAIDYFKNAKPKDIDLLNKCRYDLAQLFKSLNRSRDQNEVLNAIIDEGKKDIVTCRAHADIGRIIAIKGDFETALQYLNSALADSSLTDDLDNELIIRDKIIYIYGLKYQSIFKAEDDNPDLKNIKRHHAEVERKFARSKMPLRKKYSMLNNLAIVSSANEEGLNTALEAYNKSLEYYQRINDDYEVLHLKSNIGTIYSKLNIHKKANALYKEVIETSSDLDQRASAYVNMGYFSDVESATMRIPYYFKAFDILLDRGTNDSGLVLLPTLEEIRNSEFETDFLEYLIDLASIYFQSFKESNDESYLYNAKDAIFLIDNLVSRIRYESLSEKSTLFWIEKNVDTYMLGVEVCQLLNLPDEAFYFMEKNKALLLQENIKTLQAKWELEIPNETLELEYSLYYQKKEWYEKFLKQPDNNEIKQTYSKINKTYSVFMDSLEQRYPGYTKTKQQVEIISIDEAISQYASDEKCFVEYILNDANGFGIFCSTDEKLLFKIPDLLELQSELDVLKTYWTKSILDKKETAEFQKLANSVFLKLFPFENAKDKLFGKQLTIIADQNLYNVPFEALATLDNTDLSDSYLINYSEISYEQSISVSQQIKQKENNPQFSILGVAPYEFDLGGLPELSMSKNAIEALSDYKDSRIMVESNARKSDFLEEADKFEIIHLNTHAGINTFDLEPWIAFRDEKMALSELYGKENQAELVVLDACKTNDGKQISGEGILNLARGFFYNGAQSVLASNWNVNEKTGNEIIQSFYRYIAKGKTKSKALQQAKIDYLKSHQYSETLPYYWATFTLTGSRSPIILQRSENNLHVFSAIAFVLLFLIFYFRSRQSFNPN